LQNQNIIIIIVIIIKNVFFPRYEFHVWLYGAPRVRHLNSGKAGSGLGSGLINWIDLAQVSDWWRVL
jgi:hypothetical protein